MPERSRRRGRRGIRQTEPSTTSDKNDRRITSKHEEKMWQRRKPIMAWGDEARPPGAVEGGDSPKPPLLLPGQAAALRTLLGTPRISPGAPVPAALPERCPGRKA